MRLAGIQGLHRRKSRGCAQRNLNHIRSDDLVERNFAADGPDCLGVSDVTEHLTAEARSSSSSSSTPRAAVVGWSIADRLGSESVVDALQMAVWRRCSV